MLRNRWQILLLILLTLFASVGSVWCTTSCLPLLTAKHCPKHPAPQTHSKACGEVVWEQPELVALTPPARLSFAPAQLLLLPQLQVQLLSAPALGLRHVPLRL